MRIFRHPIVLILFLAMPLLLSAQPTTFRTNVDDLPLRSSPDLKGKKIGFIKEGAPLTSLDERSGPNLQITIRGISYDAPWYKVRSEDGKTGWVFRGSVRWLTGQGGDDFDTELHGRLKSVIANLDRADPGSTHELIDFFHGNYNLDAPVDANMAYQPILFYLYEVAGKMLELAYSSEEMEGAITQHLWNPERPVTNTRAKHFLEMVEENGLKLEGDGEGGINVDVNRDFLRQHLSIYLSADMSRYLEQVYKENEAGYAADAGLTISALDLARRAVWWDRFQTEMQDGERSFEYPEEVSGRAHDYFYTLLYGLDNTPAFYWGDESKVEPEFKEAYLWTAQQSDTYAGKFCRIFVEKLEESGWVMTAELEKMREDGEKGMLD